MKIQQNYSEYYLNNPSNNVMGITNCTTVPGVTCRAMNVKLSDTIDTETTLLRGVPSDTIQVPVQVPEIEHRTPVMPFSPLSVLPTESTRVSKSCYFEQSQHDRLEGILPPDYEFTRNVTPEWISPTLLVGASSRMDSKYSQI